MSDPPSPTRSSYVFMQKLLNLSWNVSLIFSGIDNLIINENPLI
jgi:hypothetical protein